MKKLTTILLGGLLSFASLIGNAQTTELDWAFGLVSDGELTPWAIATDQMGNIVTTGYFSGACDFNPGDSVFMMESKGYNDIFIQKVTPQGEFLWARRVGNDYTDRSNDVAVDANGNIFITGTFAKLSDFDTENPSNNPEGDYNIYIAKYNADGKFMWVKTIDQTDSEYSWLSNSGLSLNVDSKGELLVTGYFQGKMDFDPGVDTFILEAWGVDCFVLKLSNDGDFIWAKMLTSYGDVEGHTLTVDAQDNVYIAGSFDDRDVDFNPGEGEFILQFTGERANAFLLKLNSRGEFKWAIKPGGGALEQNYELKRPMAIDSKGNVILSFIISSFYPSDLDPSSNEAIYSSTGGDDIYVQKLDSLGNLLWIKQLGGEDDDLVSDVVVDEEDNIYLAGAFYNEMDFDPTENEYLVTKGWDVGNVSFVAKFNENGEFQWVSTIENPAQEWTTGNNLDLALDAENNVICSGYMYASSYGFGNAESFVVVQGGEDYSGYVYKLKQVDGTNAIATQAYKFETYPIPVNTELKVDLMGQVVNAKVTIYTTDGKPLIHSNVENQNHITIDVSGLNSGVYLVGVDNGHTRRMKRIVKL